MTGRVASSGPMIATGRSNHHIRSGSVRLGSVPKIDHSTPRDSAMPVVWNRNSGSANRVNTRVARANAPPLPSARSTARPDQLGEADLEDRSAR